jgi:hypothetical protein
MPSRLVLGYRGRCNVSSVFKLSVLLDLYSGPHLVRLLCWLHGKRMYSLCCRQVQDSRWLWSMHRLWPGVDRFIRPNIVRVQRRLHGKCMYSVCSREVQDSHWLWRMHGLWSRLDVYRRPHLMSVHSRIHWQRVSGLRIWKVQDSYWPRRMYRLWRRQVLCNRIISLRSLRSMWSRQVQHSRWLWQMHRL